VKGIGKTLARQIRTILANLNPRHRQEVIGHPELGVADAFERLSDGPDGRGHTQAGTADASLIEATHQMRKKCDRLLSRGRYLRAATAARGFIARVNIDSVNTGDVGALRAIAQFTDDTPWKKKWRPLAGC
jgi:hypothetical protein